jgi:hypothetical protein
MLELLLLVRLFSFSKLAQKRNPNLKFGFQNLGSNCCLKIANLDFACQFLMKHFRKSKEYSN